MEERGTGRFLYPNIRTRSQTKEIAQLVKQLEGLVSELSARLDQLLLLYRKGLGPPLSDPDFVPQDPLPGLPEPSDGQPPGVAWLAERNRAFGLLSELLAQLLEDQRGLRPSQAGLLELLAYFHTGLRGLEVDSERLLGALGMEAEAYLGPLPGPGEVLVPGEVGGVFRRKVEGLLVCLGCASWLRASQGGFLAFL